MNYKSVLSCVCVGFEVIDFMNNTKHTIYKCTGSSDKHDYSKYGNRVIKYTYMDVFMCTLKVEAWFSRFHTFCDFSHAREVRWLRGHQIPNPPPWQRKKKHLAILPSVILMSSVLSVQVQITHERQVHIIVIMKCILCIYTVVRVDALEASGLLKQPVVGKSFFFFFFFFPRNW